MKWFYLQWKDGNSEYISGTSESNAFETAGITTGCLQALDYYKEVFELPHNLKSVIFIRKNGERDVLDYNTVIAKRIKDNVDSTESFEVKIGHLSLRMKNVEDDGLYYITREV